MHADKDKNMFVASDKMVTVTSSDATSGVVIEIFKGNDNLSAVGVSPDRKTVMTGASGGTVRIVDSQPI